MGSIWTPPNELAAFFGEQVGLKAGLALTHEELVDCIGIQGCYCVGLRRFHKTKSR